jgi:hypothetical protein
MSDIVVKSVQAYQPAEGDILFVEVDEWPDPETVIDFQDLLRRRIPELRDVIVLHGGRPVSAPEPA